jgi:phosphohistidine phosphatase SixA
VVSSPAKRCIQTVEDYAKKARVPVEQEPALGELAAHTDFDKTFSVFMKYFKLDETVLCSHLPVVVRLADVVNSKLAKKRARKKIGKIKKWQPAGVLVLHIQGKKVVDLDFY